MKFSSGPTDGKIEFLSGWRFNLQRARQLAATIKYLIQPENYPLFQLRNSKHGLFETYKIASKLKLRKAVRFNNSYFHTPMIPHYPSRAYDTMVAHGGLNVGAAGTDLKRHIDTVILGITRQCNLHCQHCYEHHNIGSDEVVSTERWKEVIRDLQKFGTSIIVLSGGEPFNQFDRTLELLEVADKGLSDFHVHTSGHGVTFERAEALRQAGLTAAAVGLDDVDQGRHDMLRGFPGSHTEAIRALQHFHDAGVFTYVNLCLTKELVRSGDLWRYFELAKELHVGFIQMLEPRPCGGYQSEKADSLFSRADQQQVLTFFEKGNANREYKDYPLIYYVADTESPEHMGCMMGGLSHLTIDSRGNVNPCVFLPVRFGNILTEDFRDIYRRMRKAIPHPLHCECPSIYLSHAIQQRVSRGMKPPLPYNELSQEWEAMFSSIEAGAEQTEEV